MVKRVIVLANGRSVSLRVYAKAWRELTGLPRDAQIRGFDYFAMSAGAVLDAVREGLMDRINRHIPDHGRGRKWSSDWQRMMGHAARQLNTPRLIIDWLPPELQARFGRRLRAAMED